jgi:hypothetical protein
VSDHADGGGTTPNTTKSTKRFVVFVIFASLVPAAFARLGEDWEARL